MSVRAGRCSLLVVTLAAATATGACRLLTQEVVCARDGDCPSDVGLGFCDLPDDTDGGVGTCVAVDDDPSPAGDGGGGGFPFLDAGPRDGGS